VFKHSELLLTDLMEQTEVPVLSQPKQFGHLITHIFDSVVLGQSDHLNLTLGHGVNVDFDFLSLPFFNLHFLVYVVVDVASEFDFSGTEQSEGLLEFLFGEVAL
jgi:hypothetical protein